MITINNLTHSLEMTNLKFRLAVIYCAIFRERLDYKSESNNFNDDFIKKFKLALKKK